MSNSLFAYVLLLQLTSSIAKGIFGNVPIRSLRDAALDSARPQADVTGGLTSNKFVVNKADVELADLPLMDFVKKYQNPDAYMTYTRPAGREDYKLKAYLSSIMKPGSVVVDIGAGPWEFGTGGLAMAGYSKTKVVMLSPLDIDRLAERGI
jgi:hypothetical protein